MGNVKENVKVKMNNTVKRGKAGFFRVVFSRTGVIVLMLLIQIVIILLLLIWLKDYFVFIYGSFTLASFILIIHIINRNDNPIYLMTWIIPILLIPVFGALLYFFVQLRLGTRMIYKRLEVLIRQTSPFLKQNECISEELEILCPAVAGLSKYMADYGGFPINKNTSVKYFAVGEEKFEDLKTALEQAKDFIFLEYFIVKEGHMWNTILEILERKAKEGVEVRFMYDGMCALTLLPYKYEEQIRAKGIKCKTFAPIYPAISTHQNNRDHRKIVVIDGHTAFTGGINLADEYINVDVRFGHWKDTAVMLKGEAVKSFTLMFLQLWNLSEKQPEDFLRYIDLDYSEKAPGNGYVMGYGDSPLDSENVGEQVYLHILNNARKYVHIMTPYLILDYEVQQTLKFAAKRGVEVIIIMPGIPDKKYAFLLAKTYYEDLIKAGVKIYEYTPGFMHAKSFVADNDTAVVGSINLDYRSFFLHYECAAYLYKNLEILKIEEDFQNTIKKSHLVTLEDCKKLNIIERFAGKALRLFAPLM